MDKKIKLTPLGFSFNQTQSGTYGLVLGEEGGLRRIMIVVGTPEAQSIAFKLHDANPPRPLTHDIIQIILAEFDIQLKEVIIYKYDDGVFFSKLLLVGTDNIITAIDTRTSDAIAIALRTKSPIYTTEFIMRELGVVLANTEFEADNNISIDNEEFKDIPNMAQSDYSSFSDKDLDLLLSDAISKEDYEMAMLIKKEIDTRQDLKKTDR